MRRLAAALLLGATSLQPLTVAAQDPPKADAARVFGRVEGPPVASAPQPDPEVARLRAELAEMRAREARAVQPAPMPMLPPAYARAPFDLARLSVEDQYRYMELEGMRRGIGGPITLTALGGASVVLVIVGFFASQGNEQCLDEYGNDVCAMPVGVMLAATLPGAAAVTIGSVLLSKRLHRRRELAHLTRKAMWHPVMSNRSAGLSISF